MPSCLEQNTQMSPIYASYENTHTHTQTRSHCYTCTYIDLWSTPSYLRFLLLSVPHKFDITKPSIVLYCSLYLYKVALFCKTRHTEILTSNSLSSCSCLAESDMRRLDLMWIKSWKPFFLLRGTGLASCCLPGLDWAVFWGE